MDSVHSPLDVTALREDTLGCAGVIHLNNAGSALPPAVVVDTMVEHLRREELIGGYEAHAEATDRIARVYDSVAHLIHARADQVALVESATAAWDRAFVALKFSNVVVPGSRILVSSAEYASNVLPAFQVAKALGCQVEFIPDGADGTVDVNALKQMLDEDVHLVAINHCPSQNGLINDAAAIGAAIRERSSAYYLLDACQSIGQLDVNVENIGADFVSATSRKFLRGPRGSGFLYASDRALTELEPFPLDLHSATWVPDGYEIAEGAKRFESWEKSYAAVLGLGAAVDYALNLGMDRIRERISHLAEYTRSGLATIEGVTILDRGGSPAQRSGIVTLTRQGIAATDLVVQIKAAGVNVSLSTPDYSRIDFDGHGIPGLVRVSPHVFNTEWEIDRLLEVVAATS